MYFEKDDFELYYEKYGTGEKNIVILPGWGETRNTFFKFINYFKNNYTIYIIDYPGFGNSPFPNLDLDIYQYSSLIKDFLEELNIDRPILICHSFGGRIATILTGFYQVKIEKMVYMDTAGIKPRKKLKTLIKEKIYKLKKTCIQKFCKKSKEKKLERLRRKYGSVDYNTLPVNMLATFRNIVNEDLRRYFEKISSEVLLIWGAKDLDTPLKDGYFMNKKIENSALIIFPEGSHFTYLEYSDAVHLIIESFIDEKDVVL